jgi:hypothetical protein
MKKTKSFLIICYILVISCQNNDKKMEVVDSRKKEFKESKYFDEDRIKEDKYQVKYYGDNRAFGELELYYSYNQLRIEEVLPYALLMVEKHQKYKHCTTLVNYFINFYTGVDLQYDGTEDSSIKYLKNFEKLSSDQRNYILYFIKLGALHNDYGSMDYLRLLNREGIAVEKNIKKSDSLNLILNKFPRSIK